MTNHDISQTTARALRAALRHVSNAYRISGSISTDDMKIVWGTLNIAAIEEEGRHLWPHQAELLNDLFAAERANDLQLAAE